MELEGTGEIRAEKNENQNHAEPDLPPEYCHYQDDGCELATSCLHCPFSKCLYEEPGGKQHYLKKRRNRDILRLYTGGKGIKELATRFGVSQRTIQRALKRTKNE